MIRNSFVIEQTRQQKSQRCATWPTKGHDSEFGLLLPTFAPRQMNQMNQMNQINQINQMNQMNQMNQINQMNQMSRMRRV